MYKDKYFTSQYIFYEPFVFVCPFIALLCYVCRQLQTGTADMYSALKAFGVV